MFLPENKQIESYMYYNQRYFIIYSLLFWLGFSFINAFSYDSFI